MATAVSSPVAVLHANDDVAEKKKRRQSLVDERKRRKSIMPDTQSPMKKAVASTQQVQESAPLPVFQHLSEEELSGMYNEWMKIAADNKINASNTWNVALIDYFHDLSLMKEGDSINFQKASVTLDGCIKVYSSRIDSVSTETNKLLTGLATASDDADNDGDGGAEDGGDDDDSEKVQKKKRSARSVVTLESNPETLKFKTLDCNLHLTVDPLFKKTSAEFDEGGATGLLLNKLNSGADGRLVFSSNDSAVTSTEDADVPVPAAKPKLFIGKLKEQFLPQLKTIWTREVCATFKSFSFSNNTGSDTYGSLHDLEESAKAAAGAATASSAGASEAYDNYDYDGGNPDDNDDLGADDEAPGFDDDGYGDYDDGDNDAGENANPKGDRHLPVVPIGSNPQIATAPSASSSSSSALSTTLAMNQGLGAGDYAHFDSALTKNWAGPEHWRLRRFAQKSAAAAAEGGSGTSGDGAGTKKKREKKVFRIDFFSQDDANSNKKSIWGPKGGATIRLAEVKGTKSTHLLPDDLHFSSKNLTRLFTKPLWTIKLKKPTDGKRGNTAIESDGAAGADGGAAFWSEAAFSVPFGGEDYHQDGPNVGDTTLANATFFEDDDDDDFGGDNDTTQIVSNTLGDLDSTDMVARPKTIKKVHISFAKTAKRVDVKKLKDNLWKQLTTVSAPAPVAPEKPSQASDEVTGTLQFSEVIQTLPQLYPPNKAKDISVPFCFICLLHLANEKNLVIDGSTNLLELSISQSTTALVGLIEEPAPAMYEKPQRQKKKPTKRQQVADDDGDDDDVAQSAHDDEDDDDFE